MPQAITQHHVAAQATSSGTAQLKAKPDSAALHDTVAIDSAALNFKPHYVNGFPPMKGNDMATTHLKDFQSMELPQGENAASYRLAPLHDTGSMILLLLSVFLITISYKTGYKYIENFFHNMFSVRKRENLFEDHTVSELGIMSTLIFNTSVMEGLLMYYGIGYIFPHLLPGMTHRIFLFVALFAGCAVVFYLLQMSLFYVLGFVFSDKLETKIWINGFKASQSLLGLLLFPVTVVLLVYPSTIEVTLPIALGLYICGRLVFIYKGFRIFFNKLSSSVYFILYLCGVEIVPPVLFCVATIKLCIILQS